MEQLLHVAKINSKACLDLFLLGSWTLLTVALLLDVELDEPGPETFEYRVIVESWAAKRLLTEVEALHCLGLRTDLVKVAVAVVEVGIDLLACLLSVIVSL